MVRKLEIVTVGDTLGIVLSKEVCSNWALRSGTHSQSWKFPGGIQLLAMDNEHTETMKTARRVMCENREVVKRLADS